jgi:hypothetical protein
MTPEKKIEEIKKVLSEQPANQWETPAEAQAKLYKISKIIHDI